ncbi:MAG: 16S rRNA (uracil(1498)-N(3))-methyltransferase [Nitrospira sp.]|nr:16S rRNA (uracil(1498)-N(3))-methyltransferase [Candidatus Manganitrophaceae bacterium]HIL35023.1 16S rRNA (uracil(1498)-N(3))-methyltransferase [Candidatus Manganitrophaceae bacterium]
MPVYFIRSEQITDKRVEIDDSLAHHLRNVLRLREGETLSLVDERPRRYLCRVTLSSSSRFVLTIEKEEGPPEENRPMIRLGIGLLKGEKMDWVVQKATELGVVRISPLVTQRVIARPRPDRAKHQQRRWEKIAREAAQQSGRWKIPSLDLPASLPDFMMETAGERLKMMFIQEASQKLAIRELIGSLSDFSLAPQATLLIGPEGGWVQSERDGGVQQGFTPLSLGPRTLRAETAALAALSVVQYEFQNLKRGEGR